MLKGNLIYNKPRESGPSYYVMDKNVDSNVDANNIENRECMRDNYSDELDVFLTIVTPTSRRDERSENLGKTLLQKSV